MSTVAASTTESTFGSIFVTNLDGAVDNKKLFDTFCVYGTMISCNVVLDSTGASKGFAFVYFETQEAAQKAILEANGMMIAGKKIVVAKCQTREELAQKKNESEELNAKFEHQKNMGFKSVNLFVKNIDARIDDEAMKNIFVPFGPMTSVKVMRDESGRSKGFGFVCFSNADDANKALNVVNLKKIYGKPLFVSIAQRKEDRQSQLASQMSNAQRGDERAAQNGGTSPQRSGEGLSMPAATSARRRQFSPEPDASVPLFPGSSFGHSPVAKRPHEGLGQYAQDRVEAPEIVYGLIKMINLDKDVETKIIAVLLEQDDDDLIRMAHDIHFFDSMVEEAFSVLQLPSMNLQQPFMRPIRI